MNQDYNGTGLGFQLQNTTRTLNATWFNNVAPGTDLQTDMKHALRQGDVKTLNIYTVSFNTPKAQDILGYSTFPADYAANPMDDGVVVLYSSFPGGSTANFSLGRTSTHEVGHWLGLYHPFQGGCTGDGDFVDDTPAEASPASGCPIGRDTCPSPGLDREWTTLNPNSSPHFVPSRSKLHGLCPRLVHEQLHPWSDRAHQVPDLDLPRNKPLTNRTRFNVHQRFSPDFVHIPPIRSRSFNLNKEAMTPVSLSVPSCYIPDLLARCVSRCLYPYSHIRSFVW